MCMVLVNVCYVFVNKYFKNIIWKVNVINKWYVNIFMLIINVCIIDFSFFNKK